MPRGMFPRAESFRRDARDAFKAQKLTGARVLGSFIALAGEAARDDGWVVLAYEVSMARTKVTLTREDFQACVKNFALYPCCPVTIEHADLEGGPAAWAEPHGHIEALRVGEMKRTVDGVEKTVATLEGRPSYLAATAADVTAGKWRYGSIGILKGVVDEESSAKLGTLLWSWSLTAHPRLMGLARIAAARVPEGERVEAGYWYGSIDDRDDLIACLREILDLPVTATEADVLAELTKLEELAGAADTRGVDVERIVERLREALRLPALTTTDGVLAEVRKGLANLPTDAAEDGGDGPHDSTLSRRPPAAPATKESTMFKFLPLLATFGLSVATEDDAQARAATFAQLGADALKALGLPVTASVQEFSAKLSQLATDAAQVKGLQAELESFRAKAAETARTEREKYFTELFAVRPELKSAEGSLRLHAERDPEGFSKAYPRPSAEQLLASAQHGARTEVVTAQPGAAGAPATFAAPSAAADTANAITSMVHTHIQMARAGGRELSFSAALAELGG